MKKTSERNTTHFMHNTLFTLGFAVLKTTKKKKDSYVGYLITQKQQE
jgi:hypothetical protein